MFFKVKSDKKGKNMGDEKDKDNDNGKKKARTMETFHTRNVNTLQIINIKKKLVRSHTYSEE